MAKPKKRAALGRGLGSILPTDVPNKSSSNQSTADIPVRQIERNPYQPRQEFDELALQELADSIKVHGIIQPITVRKLAENKFQLISGERRLRASKIAGLSDIPAYIRTANDEEMLEMALIENIQREDLNPIEIALTYQRMIDELGLKQEDLGGKVGKGRSTVTNFLALLKLPTDVQAGLRDNSISTGHAKALNGLGEPAMQLAVYKDIVEQELSVRKTEELVKRLKQPKKQQNEDKKDAGNSAGQIHLNKVGDQLTSKFGNKVRLSQKSNGQGEITIPFNSTEDLNWILSEILDS
ncbi:MAG: ParB/RepB/Spo0J family partition protein [Bacteroidota bacterium]